MIGRKPKAEPAPDLRTERERRWDRYTRFLRIATSLAVLTGVLWIVGIWAFDVRFFLTGIVVGLAAFFVGVSAGERPR